MSTVGRLRYKLCLILLASCTYYDGVRENGPAGGLDGGASSSDGNSDDNDDDGDDGNGPGDPGGDDDADGDGDQDDPSPGDGGSSGNDPDEGKDVAILVGAGDIASCESDGDEQTADLLDGLDGTIFLAGDIAYDDGTAQEFAECFDTSWGRHRERMRPAPGNHEY